MWPIASTSVSTYIRCTREYLKNIFLINFCHQKQNFYLNFSNMLNACWSCVSIWCKRYTCFLVVFMISYIVSHLWWSNKNNTKGKNASKRKPFNVKMNKKWCPFIHKIHSWHFCINMWKKLVKIEKCRPKCRLQCHVPICKNFWQERYFAFPIYHKIQKKGHM